MKKRIWTLHSWLGLVCGLALVVIGLTGSVLVFHQEINRAFFGETVLTDAPEGSQRLPLPSLVASTQERFPDFWISGWLPNRDPSERDIAYLKPRGTDDWHKLRVDQFSGETAERPLPYRDTLHGWFVDLHYTFFADHLGLGITAAFALGLIALSVTGIWIYRAFWKNLFRLRWGRSLRLFCSDLHKAVGIASAPLNLLLGFTGAYWNIAHLAHEWEEHAHEEEHAIVDPLDNPLPLGQLTETAFERWPDFQLNYLYFPTSEDPNLYLYGSHSPDNPLRSPYGSWMGVDAQSGAISSAHDLRAAGLGAQVVDAFEPLHFGDFGGIASKILWCLAGLAPGILALSGSLIYFSRKRKADARPARHPAARESTLAA